MRMTKSHERTSRDAKRSVGCLLILGGFLFGGFAMLAILDTSLFMARSIRASGVVTQVQEWTEWRQGYGNVRFRVAVVRFLVHGRQVEARIGEDPVPVEGAIVHLRYLVHEPETARRDDALSEAYHVPIFSGIIALAAVLAGLLIGRQSKSGRGT